MLHASCYSTPTNLTPRGHEVSRRAVPTFLRVTRGPACKPTSKAPLARRLRANGFFEDVFKRNKPHAPELVRLDTEDEGGLGQTSAELFGPLVSHFPFGSWQRPLQDWKQTLISYAGSLAGGLFGTRSSTIPQHHA